MNSLYNTVTSNNANNYNLSENRIPHSFYLDDVKQKKKEINIIEIIGRHVDLKKSGSSWKGICPFHDEKTSSFDVDEKKGTFKCFGCGEQGDVISFIMKFNNVGYPDALKYLGINSSANQKTLTRAIYEKTESTGNWQIKKKDFTNKELSFLGPKVSTQLCEKFKFFSLESYTTPEGHRYSSTPEYPIFVADFGDWQKIYQPLSPEKSYRFMFIDKKNQPKDFMYGFHQALESKKRLNENNETNNEKSPDDDLKLDLIIKASGERDALNLASLGYNVFWLDSEAQILGHKQYHKLTNIANEIYNLPDIDNAGIKYAYKLNLKFLNIKTIWLPQTLLEKKDSRGYPCKDFTDFVKHNARETENGKLLVEYEFKRIREASVSLNFIAKEKKDKGSAYIIKNTRLYNFLIANGFYRYYPYFWNKSVEGIIKVCRNIVEKVESTNLLVNFVIEYMKDNYYDEKQMDAVYRSNQLSETSIQRGLEIFEIKDKYYSPEHQDLFFNNNHWRITKNGLEECNINHYENHIWKNRIINRNVKKVSPLFSVDYSDDYKSLYAKYKGEKNPGTKDQLKNELDNFPEIDKYNLEIHNPDFSLFKFLINTSDFYWQKTQNGEELSEIEKKETNLHIINKLWVLGYLMTECKEKSKPYAPIFLDGDNSEVGEHRGGTGKSFTSKLPFLVKTNDVDEAVKNNVIDAQQKTINDDKYKMANLEIDLRYVVYNDCHLGFKFHQHLNEMDGSFSIRKMHKDPISIPYNQSPKIAFTLNHAIKNDGSLSRRAVPVIFSDYYHAAGEKHKTEFNPKMEFGKNLLDDYDDAEMNLTYNLLANCTSLYLKFPEKINPPMERINLRNIRMKVGEPFYQWAVEKFISDIETMTINNEMLELYIAKKDLYNQFMEDINLSARPSWDKQKYNINSFKKHLKDFCDNHGIIMNPSDVEGYEKERKRIRKILDSKKKEECFYFRASDLNKIVNVDDPNQDNESSEKFDLNQNEEDSELLF